jgi:hypothetical protein
MAPWRNAAARPLSACLNAVDSRLAAVFEAGGVVKLHKPIPERLKPLL